ncbi:hypothetical protein GT755_18320 [Herbidospora sp. NEAU-GS84]|uniref:CopG family transcriptional regulator n=1 Tax=Herbidospora solisilvae TaxID=2696284 RepID=A0A7C9JFB5_9ACTN|nr:hypothetical protein [Herbidospora solisilvae]NAS23643.1 hypothetical protein [Herbidospora solisilvae]
MSETKKRITVTVDHALNDFAERMVETGRAASVSAVVSTALAALHARELRGAKAWQDKLDEAAADPTVREKVDRMMASVHRQLREQGLPGPGAA